MATKVTVTSKFCPKCCAEKDASEFNKANRRDGLRSWCRACENEYSKSKNSSLKDQVYKKLGQVCTHCGFSDKRALQIDHVFGGGNQEHSEIKNNASFLRKVIDDQNGTYQILCANCNWIKRSERSENPKDNQISDEAKKRMSEKAKVRIIPEDQLRRMRESHLGQQLTEPQLQKRGTAIAESWKDPVVRKAHIDGLTGKKRTEEQRAAFRMISIKREQSKTFEQRSAIALARESSMAPGRHSEGARKREAAMTPEQKSERARKAAATKAVNKATRLSAQHSLPTNPVREDFAEETDVTAK